MSIVFKTLTVRNFLSVGQLTQTVNINNNDLMLVLGVNEDLGGENGGSRNGVGKSTLLNALSYSLFGVALSAIRKDNLINRTNQKGMLVTLDFEVDGKQYRIERGRKPNVLRFYIADKLQDEALDQAQGENARTQEEIERLIKMTPDMFKQVVALNTYSEPFLAMKAQEQRLAIEQLLGITLLSERADALKDLMRQVREQIMGEELRIKAVNSANERVTQQIEQLQRRQALWLRKRDEDVAALKQSIEQRSAIDIESELRAHVALKEWSDSIAKIARRDALVARQNTWLSKRDGEIANLTQKLETLAAIDIERELIAHRELGEYNERVRHVKDRDAKIKAVERELERERQRGSQLQREIELLIEHRCHACGSELHDEQHERLLSEKRGAMNAHVGARLDLETQLHELSQDAVEVGDKPTTHYTTLESALKHQGEVERLAAAIEGKLGEIDPYSESIAELAHVVAGDKPQTHYDTQEEAFAHSTVLSGTVRQLAERESEVDPYSEQLCDMQANALQPVSFDEINDLTRMLEHQKFLHDLLTNKDSFVRRRIISQNLQFLNSRLSTYLQKMGLPHDVVFKDDLSVEITEYGREMDFPNLSRGESNRLILALAFAFRDVWESLYGAVNFLGIDELLDSGMDAAGVENGIALLKEMSRRRGRSIWLISHREELITRVPQVLRVVKSNGFTEYVS